MARENFQITEEGTGKKYWISRSCAVVACIVAKNSKGHVVGLFEKRGPGCPDYVGCYAFPCGYLGWDETRKEAVIREVREELGLDISMYKIREWKFIDAPLKDDRQNICTRYIIEVPFDDILGMVMSATFNSRERGGEEGEVSEVRLINLSTISEHPELPFAFKHDQIFREVAEEVTESKIKKIIRAIKEIL